MLLSCVDHPRRFVTAIVVLGLIWLFTLSGFRSERYEELSFAQTSVPQASKEEWLALVENREFNGTAIRELCDAQKVWTDTVVIDARDVQGGIGNIRQEILSAIRYAIDAGAALVIPKINLRSDDLLNMNIGKKIDMSYVFDKEEFLRRMHLACPQMKLYESEEEVRARGPVVEILGSPRDMDQENGPNLSINSDIESHRAPLGHITLVAFRITLGYYPICTDPEPFANTFSTLLPLRTDTLRLAASALHSLSTRFSLPLHPSQFHSFPNFALDPASPPPSHAYLAVHLRTSADAVMAGWTGFDKQAARYLDRAQHVHRPFSSSVVSAELSGDSTTPSSGLAKKKTPSKSKSRLPLIYVASGNYTSVQALRTLASTLHPPIPVITKEDLLSPAELATLQQLTWDQQALVDLQLLLWSSYFVGTTESSFSASVAFARRVVNGRGTCGGREPGWADEWVDGDNRGGFLGWGGDDGEEDEQRGWPPETAYMDRLSELMGRGPDEWETKMWP